MQQQWRRKRAGVLCALWFETPPALTVTEQGLALWIGEEIIHTPWAAVSALQSRKTGQGRQARWHLDVKTQCPQMGLQYLSCEITGLDAPWPRILQACRSAWAAAQGHAWQTSRAPPRPQFAWTAPHITLRRGNP